MIVYRDQNRPADPHRLLSHVRAVIAGVGAAGPSHDLAIEALLDIGELECALADAIFGEADGLHPLTQRMRRASLGAAHVLWHTWHSRTHEARAWWSRCSGILDEIECGELPSQVVTSVAEGYQYYAVYPEMYLEAAKRCAAALGPFGSAVCLGLRSIGVSLSAVVAAALEELGYAVESFTLRPRGHPFSRYPSLHPDLVSRLATLREAHFLLVDEGPGISGSSLAGTATMLRSWGIADDHIHFFPSWRTDGSRLRSELARERWPKHRQFVTSFEEVWLDDGRLQETFPGDLQDVSAGAWRPVVYRQAELYPAVQPQHERRKYLLRSTHPGNTPRLLRFVGLGSPGERKIQRARRVADAGFTPRPESVAHGFVLRPFIAGRPVERGTADPLLLDTVAAYLAHLDREHRVEPSVSDSTLRDMIAVNVAEGLQDSSAEKSLARLPSGTWPERPVALDGRMLVHEWIRTPTGYLKVDAMDHHDDHFFPGSQDIAWDVAGATIELDLGRQGRDYLIERYRCLSGDRTIEHRIRPYAVAYLAFRLGYTALATTVLGGTPDGSRFAHEARWYADVLGNELHG